MRQRINGTIMAGRRVGEGSSEVCSAAVTASMKALQSCRDALLQVFGVPQRVAHAQQGPRVLGGEVSGFGGAAEGRRG
ncbi:hypothetical protein ACIQVN_25110 [Streptomyces cyaneofuscatus]|uniref:hypothetical protein n=1 Tax=Streptomyces cyaneofuscatus TaxID=66883 RepID=UPI003803E6C3